MRSFETVAPSSIHPAPQKTRPANFDPLARVYRWMEYFSFGPTLERCRFHFLPQYANVRHALILGDGDGRFTARFLKTNSVAQIDAVDASAAMLTALEHRANRADPRNKKRLRTIHADLRQWIPSDTNYDLVVSHFFLDCLTDAEIDALIARIVPSLAPDAEWLVSEFAIPAGRWRGAGARFLIRFLYFAFSWMTGLRVQQLPDYAAALSRHGFHLHDQRQSLSGLLVSQIWAHTDF